MSQQVPEPEEESQQQFDAAEMPTAPIPPTAPVQPGQFSEPGQPGMPSQPQGPSRAAEIWGNVTSTVGPAVSSVASKVGPAVSKGQVATSNWTYDLGSWIYGVLLAASLLIFANVLFFGASDRASVVAAVFVGLALPLNATGVWIVRYARSLSPSTLAVKRSKTDILASLVLVLGTIFTAIGLLAALVRISWVVVIFFLLAIVASLFVVYRFVRS